MWKLEGRPVTTRVTKTLAKEFAEMDPAPHDRPLSERRLQVYQRLLAEGAFRPVTWAKAFCKETNQEYRVNGKHTSVMLSGLDKMPEFYVTVEDYSCDTLDDVARLYATFDSKMMSRTASDIYMSFAATVPQLAEFPRRLINVAVAGMQYGINLNEGGNTQPAERAEFLLEYPDFVVWVAKILRTGEGGDRTRPGADHIYRGPVVAAMFNTWQKVKSAATDFWTMVRDETGDTPQVPDRKLAKYLTFVSLNRGKSSRDKIKTADNREVYVKCVHAWNAWRTGESTNLNYHAEAKIPAVK